MSSSEKGERPPFFKLEEGLQLIMRRIEKRWRAHMERCADLFYEYKLEEAIQCIDEFLEENSNNIDAIGIKILSLLELDRFEEFIEFANQSLVIIKEDFDLLASITLRLLDTIREHASSISSVDIKLTRALETNNELSKLAFKLLDLSLAHKKCNRYWKGLISLYKADAVYFFPLKLGKRELRETELECLRTAYKLIPESESDVRAYAIGRYAERLSGLEQNHGIHRNEAIRIEREYIELLKSKLRQKSARSKEERSAEKYIGTQYSTLIQMLIRAGKKKEAQKHFNDCYEAVPLGFSYLWEFEFQNIIEDITTESKFFRPDEEIDFCEIALKVVPPFRELLYVKARALEFKRRFEEAYINYKNAAETSLYLIKSPQTINHLSEEIQEGIKRCEKMIRQ